MSTEWQAASAPQAGSMHGVPISFAIARAIGRNEQYSVHADEKTGALDWEAIAAEWVRQLRGKRSQAAFSRHLGYQSSVVHRWESGAAWPTDLG